MNFLIKTLGCRVNQAESQQLREALLERGWQKGLPPDICILNTCSVTQKAEKETRQEARKLKREYPGSFLIVTGCSVDYWRKKGKLPDLGADLYIENKEKVTIPDLPEVATGFHPGSGRQGASRVFVKVQDGCNQFCTYCIVPYLRGRSRSIPAEEIVERIKKLESQATKEVILCGINLADYQPSLTPLLRKILKETKIPRIRLGSINLKAFSDEFIALWQNSRLCSHFHIPLQSACNQTLKRMGRRHTIEDFRRIAVKLRQEIAGVNITTDILVGFPDETKTEFEKGFKNLQSLKLGKIHVFRYSLRNGTKAAEMKNQVSEKTKKERAAKIRRLSQEMGEAFAKQFVAKKLKVLFETYKDGFCQGWSENYLRARVKSRGLRGKIKVVKIESEKGGKLNGRVTAE